VFSASDNYERFMGRWSRRLAPLLVAFADVAGGDEVLDVGCGTGALTFAVAAIPSTRVTGVDPSDAYVASASRDGIRFEVGDAQSLQFADDSFDKALSLLALNFVPDRDTALREMARVTRPGGVVAAAVWDYGDGMEMLRAFWDEAVALDPDAPDERHMPWSRRGELATAWREQGLHDVADTSLTIAQSFASFDDYWQPFLLGQGPAGAYMTSLPEPRRDTLRSRLCARLGNGEFTLTARAWAVRGIVPAGTS
jgi:SAM-dependent methyltransferase